MPSCECSHNFVCTCATREGESKVCGVSSYGSLTFVSPRSPATSQRPPFQTPSHCGLGLQHKHLGWGISTSIRNSSMNTSTFLKKRKILAQASVSVGTDVKESIPEFHVKAEISFLSQRMYSAVFFLSPEAGTGSSYEAYSSFTIPIRALKGISY